MARELRNLREISHGELTELVDKVDRGVTREKIVAELREHYYETRHYAMLANLLEGIGGGHVDWQDTRRRTGEGRMVRLASPGAEAPARVGRDIAVA